MQASIVIKVDSSYILGFRADPDAKCRSDNGDLWYECWRLILRKNIRLNVVKISRSHATEEMVATGIISERDRIGNHWADKYADLGAELTTPTPQQVQATEQKHAQARYVQLRLAECDPIQFEHRRGNPRARPPESDRPPPVPRPTAAQHLTRLRGLGHLLGDHGQQERLPRPMRPLRQLMPQASPLQLDQQVHHHVPARCFDVHPTSYDGAAQPSPG